MTAYVALLAKAKLMGHKLTPELRADLRTLSNVSDEKLQIAYKGYVTCEMARKFQVSPAVMERRIEGSILSLKLNN